MMTFDTTLMAYATKKPLSSRIEGDACIRCGKYQGEWHMYPSGVCHRCYGMACGEHLKKQAHDKRVAESVMLQRMALLEDQERKRFKGKTPDEHFAYEVAQFNKTHDACEHEHYKQCSVCGMFKDFPKQYRSRNKGVLYPVCYDCRGLARQKERRRMKRNKAVRLEADAISKHFEDAQECTAALDMSKRAWKRMTKSSRDALVRFKVRADRGYDIDEVKFGQRLREADWHADVWELIKADAAAGVYHDVAWYFDKEMPRIKHGIPTIEELESGRTP